MDALTLMATLGIDISQYKSGLQEAKRLAQDAGESIDDSLSATGLTNGSSGGSSGGTSRATFTQAFGGLMSSATRAVRIGTIALTAAGGYFIKSAVDTGKEFDKGISQVAATMGLKSTSDTIQTLREYAIQMGESTVFTATEATDALNYMALAGYDAERSMRTLPTVLNLAAAGALDLGYASDVVTDLGTALGLTEGQITDMTDQMAKTASISNTSVGQLSEAMLRLGANGRTVAGGTEEIAAVFGVLADNGIKGAEAGTHLRNILLELANPSGTAFEAFEEIGREIPSLFDEEGGMKDLPGYFQELKAAIGDLSDAEILSAFGDLFNDRDIAAARALMETDPERWAEMFEKLGEAAGSAGQMAHEQLNNLAGDLKLFESAYQTMQIRISDALSPMLRNITQQGTEGIKKLTENIESFLASDKGIATMDKMSVAFGKLIDTLTSTETIESVFNIITKAVEGLASAIQWIADNSDVIMGVLKTLGTTIAGLFVADKVTQVGTTLQKIGSFFGIGGGGAAGGAAAAGGGAGLFGGLKTFGSALLGSAAAPGLAFTGLVAGIGSILDRSYTQREYGDYNQGIADMNARISALEAQNDTRSSAFASMISTIGGLLESLTEGDKAMFDDAELETLKTQVETAQKQTGEDYSEILGMIDDLLNNPDNAAGIYSDLLPELGTLLVDLENKSKEAATTIAEDANAAIEQGKADFETAMAETTTDVGTQVGESIDSGSKAGSEAMKTNIETDGSSAAASLYMTIQNALNNLHLPLLGATNLVGSGVGRKHASAMSGGEILQGLTPFGVDSNGVVHYGGEAGAEAVVGVNSLDRMIKDAVSSALAGVLSRMDALNDNRSMKGVQIVLDTGAVVGGLVGEMDHQLATAGKWRGGGHA